MIYNLSILDDIGDAIVQSLRTLIGTISAALYEFISMLYQIFIYISKAQIIDNAFIEPIYRKVGFILSLFMIFKLSFSLIQSLVDPDKFTDKKNGFASVIGRSVIAIVLLGITPSIFREAYTLQNLVVGSSNRDNLIYKFIVNKSVPGDFNTLGRRLAADLYFNFFLDEEEPRMSGAVINLGPDTSESNRFPEKNLETIKEYVEEGDPNNSINSFFDTVTYLALKGENEKYVIEYSWQWILQLGFGIICAWFFINYCIQIAVRTIQLAYLQIIAPIPILSYISDPDGAFKNWIKQCTTTYLDLFIRLAIIYFVMTLIDDILTQFKDSSSLIINSSGLPASGTMTTMTKIFLILGLLMFAKKVPDLLKDLFPNMGGGVASLGFGLKSPKNLFNDIPVVGGVANKTLGYAGNLGKRFGKFAWNHTGGAAGKFAWAHTGGKIKNNYDRWKDDRKNAAEIKEMEKPGEQLFKKYGENIAESFKNDEFKKSYLALKTAKDKNRVAEKEYEEAKASGDAKRISAAIDEKNKAAKALNDAQKTHDNMRKRYGADARREDAFNMYKSMHPDKFSNNSNNRRPAMQQQATPQPQPQATFPIPAPSATTPSAPTSPPPINEHNSMFANMSDSEWLERQAQNNRDEYATKTDPNDYFNNLSQIYANEYLENNGVSDEFDKSWEAQRSAMEDAYKKAGWSQDDNGKWTKNGS